MWRYACALVLLCAAFARTDTYKRAELATAPFVLGSRYGRSSPRMIAPRNDRFFMGSRYGKRSEPARTLTPQDVTWRDVTRQDVTWKNVVRLCELQVFAPLCSLRQPPSKPLYNSECVKCPCPHSSRIVKTTTRHFSRLLFLDESSKPLRIDQESVEKMDYKD